jgi:hypothetical protein
LLVGLAEGLGGDVETAKDLGAFVPLCGIVRNFGTHLPVSVVDIIEVDARPYTLAEVETAITKRGDTPR